MPQPTRRSSTGPPAFTFSPTDPTYKLVEQLVTSLRRRQIVGSLSVALATAVLLHTVVRSARYNNITELLDLLKIIARRLAEANPKELSAGNIIRRILRLIREEYTAAAAAHISQPPSAPETPFLGPPTPANSFPLSPFSSPLPTSRPGLPHTATSLSNFVAMRHSRAQHQLERTGSILDRGSFGLAMSGIPAAGGGSPKSPIVGLPENRSSASLLSSPPSRGDSTDSLNIGFLQQLQKQQKEGGGSSSPSKMDPEEFMRQSAKLKPVLLQAIEEVMGELETTHEDVAKGAREHIHSSEIILTLGYSRTVEAFLKTAFKDRKFTVIVAESAPSNLGRTFAHSLSKSGIPTLLIPDSSLHALMPRITKLVIGCHSVLANGGLFALSGTLSAVLAARSHAKPIIVTTGQYKMAPVWNLYHHHGAFDFQGPAGLVGPKGEGTLLKDEVEVESAYWEYVRPELIDLFVTNEGDHAPSYIYRLIKEAYDDQDVEM